VTSESAFISHPTSSLLPSKVGDKHSSTEAKAGFISGVKSQQASEPSFVKENNEINERATGESNVMIQDQCNGITPELIQANDD